MKKRRQRERNRVAKDSEGKEHVVLLGSESDAILWRTLSRVMQNLDLDLPEMTELKVKAARNKYHPSFSLVKVIDLARENSLRLRYNLFRVIEDISRGDKYRTHIESLEKDDLNTVKEWTEFVWDDFSDTTCPRVWE